MNKKLFSILLIIFLMTMLLPGAQTRFAFALTEQLPVNEQTFPDEKFRDYILYGSKYSKMPPIDTDQNGMLSQTEIEAVTEIDIYRQKVTDLTGIAYFKQLKKLSTVGNKLIALDISSNTELIELSCYSCRLTDLDISNNLKLQSITCDRNKLTKLDVSMLPDLKELSCGYNRLTNLDISHNSKLQILVCGSNLLTELDLSQNPQLTRLSVGDNYLTELEVSHLSALESLYCQENLLTQLDVSKNPSLDWLIVNSNALTDLDVSKNPALDWLICSGNDLTSLDVRGLSVLSRLRCSNNRLTELRFGGNFSLRSLECEKNRLTTLQLAGAPKLQELICKNNPLTSLDFTDNPHIFSWSLGGLGTAIAVDENGQFDLSSLPDFDVTRATGFIGGKVEGNILTVDWDAQTVTYEYQNHASFKEDDIIVNAFSFTFQVVRPEDALFYDIRNFVTTTGEFNDAAYFNREAKIGDKVTLKVSLSEAGEALGMDYENITVDYDVQGAGPEYKNSLYNAAKYPDQPYKSGVTSRFRLGKGDIQMIAHVCYNGIYCGSFAPFYTNI